MALTAIGDVILVQGVASPAAQLTLEVGDGTAASGSYPVTHRFPHPDARITHRGHRAGYEITLNAHEMSGSSHIRITTSTESVPWQAVDTLSQPEIMPGIEILSRCVACEHDDLRPAGRRQQLEMTTCNRCGLVMTNPRPAEDHTLLRYSERYFEEEYLPSQQPSASLNAHLDQILDHIEVAKQCSTALFELGVGGGNLLDRARSRGWMVAGTDVNDASVAHAKDRGLRVWHENVDHASDLGGVYGAVVSEMSIEHVRRPEHFCQLAADALVPGGSLLIYTVSAEGASFEHSGMGSPLVGPAEHLFLFSAQSLVELCTRAGLRTDWLWRSPSGDEIGIVASKRLDSGNPAVPNGSRSATS